MRNPQKEQRRAQDDFHHGGVGGVAVQFVAVEDHFPLTVGKVYGVVGNPVVGGGFLPLRGGPGEVAPLHGKAVRGIGGVHQHVEAVNLHQRQGLAAHPLGEGLGVRGRDLVFGDVLLQIAHTLFCDVA